MENNDLVSVVLPCYNAMPYLKEAIDSLVNQTYKNLEIIAIDDGSTDDTYNFLIERSKKDSRIKVVKNPENIKLISTLNKGIALAIGSYIARMDADDISMPHRFETQMNFIKSSGADLISSGVEIIGDSGEKLEILKPRALSSSEINYLSMFVNPMLHPTVLCKAEVLKKFQYDNNPTSLHVEDYELWARLVRNGVKLLNQNELVLHYRISVGGISRKYAHIQDQHFAAVVKNHIESYTSLDVSDELSFVIANRFNKRNVDVLMVKNAIRLIDSTEEWFLERFQIGKKDKRDIIRISELQKLDIIIQFYKNSKNRIRTLLLVKPRIVQFLFDGKTLRYVLGKINRKRKNQEKSIKYENDQKHIQVSPKTLLKNNLFIFIKKSGIYKLKHQWSADKVYVLCFHSVSDSKNQFFYTSMPQNVFKKLLNYVKNNFEVVTFSQVINSTYNSKNPKCIITFDDGYEDFYFNALPLLTDFALPAYQSIITNVAQEGCVIWTQRFNAIIEQLYKERPSGRFRIYNVEFSYNTYNQYFRLSNNLFKMLLTLTTEEREIWLTEMEFLLRNRNVQIPAMMNWKQINQCIQQNIHIFSHTLNHINLATEKDYNVIHREIVESAVQINKNTGVTPEGITFPNSQFNNEVLNIASSHYKYLLSTEDRYFNPLTSRFNNAYLIPRINLNATTYEENIVRLYNLQNIIKEHKYEQ